MAYGYVTVLVGIYIGVEAVVTGEICDHDMFTYSRGTVLTGTTVAGAYVFLRAPVSGWHDGHTNLAFSLSEGIPTQAGWYQFLQKLHCHWWPSSALQTLHSFVGVELAMP